ncbi:MAG: RIP metalloprotease RseP [Lachnospiraceae bacterium]|uniref:RIP metalloprotease RseP n=1 Tax=Roseburia hominis TaxID=301301 RepID=UPI001F450FC1|nr:RIP metalloprotease RseP [Roseburia hominis]MCI5713458.1 RIP metalloprotease RseP [Lachnospiraceae bacterium]MDD6169966.1 RIP metalloprotease RseP [Lachnospiraceae bacterium]
MKIIIAILIFSLLIIFHELGHFLLAKKNGIRVNEFCLGLGPTVVGFTKGETKYSLHLLPFGGACMMEGEDAESDDERAFGKKSVWARISVVAAGPIFNFIMALVFSIILMGCVGYDKPVLSGVMEGYPAEEAGIEAGDTIVKLNHKSIHFWREINFYLYSHPGEELKVTYEREGERYETTLTPKYDEENGAYYAGFYGGGEKTKGNVIETLQYGVYYVKYWIDVTFESLKMLVTGQVGVQDMSGPVGIVKTIGDTYEQSKASGVFYIFVNMLNISILLSANLGVMNLLPIPALDGGRLVFLIIEAIRGKKIDPDKEGMVHFIGMACLMLLMVVVMFSDIRKLF